MRDKLGYVRHKFIKAKRSVYQVPAGENNISPSNLTRAVSSLESENRYVTLIDDANRLSLGSNQYGAHLEP